MNGKSTFKIPSYPPIPLLCVLFSPLLFFYMVQFPQFLAIILLGISSALRTLSNRRSESPNLLDFCAVNLEITIINLFVCLQFFGGQKCFRARSLFHYKIARIGDLQFAQTTKTSGSKTSVHLPFFQVKNH